jgi:hypothetical protein
MENKKWKIGDRVRFANVPPGGPSFRVVEITTLNGQQMIAVEGMVGEFGAHIFVAETPAAPHSPDETAA